MPTPEQMTPAPAGKRGPLVIAVLAIIFLTLLVLLIRYSSRERREAPRETVQFVVIPETLRIRSEASAKADVMTTSKRGDRLTLVEDAGAWVRVELADGMVGWAERSALEGAAQHEQRLQRTAAIRGMPALEGVVETTTTLYAGPGIFYPLVGEIKAGTDVRVFTRDHDFFAIDFRGDVAYADVDAIDVSAAGGAQFDVASAPSLPDNLPEPGGPDFSPIPEPQITEPEPTPVRIADERPSTPPGLQRGDIYAVVPPGGTNPQVRNQERPRYPLIARRAGVEGRVVLRGVVRKNGRIDDIQILRDLPYGLGDAAREAVRQWRFRPATYQGEPIDVYYTVTVNFRLTDN
ncbi:MAG TPA: TonB family protein [Thermoanaerobaculia bacterium]|nr:TonB family protein [Thermoanaerobaculia bacterium]